MVKGFRRYELVTSHKTADVGGSEMGPQSLFRREAVRALIIGSTTPTETKTSTTAAMTTNTGQHCRIANFPTSGFSRRTLSDTGSV